MNKDKAVGIDNLFDKIFEKWRKYPRKTNLQNM